jgi:glycosyltransferase involved in cell wall biosynthesis
MGDKILIYYSIFNVGGAERSTMKLITKLLDKQFEVEVLLITNGGKFQSQIDDRAKVRWLRSGDYGNLYAKNKGLKKVFFLFLYAITRLEEFFKGFLYRFKTYKVVIIGLHGLSPKFCLTNVKADTYIQFIRNDLKKIGDKTHEIKYQFKKYGHLIDYYVCVSQTTLDSFTYLFPELKQKGIKIYNLLQSNVILEKAKEEIIDSNWSKKTTNILTVCRIQENSKGIFRMAKVLKELLNLGYNITWYIIGEGHDFENFKKHLKEMKLEKRMILLGGKSNPYPYFKKADLVAVLSYYEGLSGVVNEAKILERPLIATEFSGIREQITEEVNGFIFDNSYDAILQGMIKLLDNPLRLNKTAVNGMPEEITNDKLKIEKLINLINKKL